MSIESIVPMMMSAATSAGNAAAGGLTSMAGMGMDLLGGIGSYLATGAGPGTANLLASASKHLPPGMSEIMDYPMGSVVSAATPAAAANLPSAAKNMGNMVPLGRGPLRIPDEAMRARTKPSTLTPIRPGSMANSMIPPEYEDWQMAGGGAPSPLPPVLPTPEKKPWPERYGSMIAATGDVLGGALAAPPPRPVQAPAPNIRPGGPGTPVRLGGPKVRLSSPLERYARMLAGLR